jgi:hypothetical protein
MSGARLLSYFQLGKETTKGTAVAASRRFSPSLDSAFKVDWMKTYHEGRSTGVRTPISYSTQQGTLVTLTFGTLGDTGVGFDELPIFLIFPGGGTAGAGATAVTWGHAWGGTAAGSAITYTAEYGDDVQEYEAEYCFAKSINISAALGGLTQLSVEMVGRQSTKSTKTALDSVQPVRIPSYLWKPKFSTAQSTLTAASTVPNFLKSWDATWTTGLQESFYMDGNAYFGQSQESAPVRGTLHMVVASNSTAVSQFYDKGAAGTVDFVRLAATGPTIAASGTAYLAQFDFAVEYREVQMISGDEEGENLYDVQAEIVYDNTWGQSIGGTVINNLVNLL